MDALVAMGTTAAYLYSVVVMVRALFVMTMENTMTFFDAAGLIITFITFGKYLEHLTRGKTSEVCAAHTYIVFLYMYSNVFLVKFICADNV